MECRFDKEIIQRYIDNRIDPLELIFLKEHLNYCTACQEEVKLLTLADQKLSNICSDIDLPFDFDVITEKILDSCLKEVEVKKGITKYVKAGYEMSKGIASNATRFAGYLPGSKLVKKGVASSVDYLGSSTKNFVKSRLKKVLGNMI